MAYCPSGGKVKEGFWMGQTEVTQALYQAVMGDNPSYFKGGNRPVERVSWFDAVRFCNKLSERQGLTPAYRIGRGAEPKVEWVESADGYRLPFEDEWEHCAKAGEDYEYSGSDNLDEVAWHEGNSDGTTHFVYQKKPNAWGLYDMSGNVWEWGHNPYGNRTGYESGGGARVGRGGGWRDGPVLCRVASRDGSDPGFRYGLLGFRLRVSVAKRR